MFDQSMQWLSRTIAIVIVMVGPGFLGSMLDQRFGTSYLTPAGFAFGMVLATSLLLILIKKLAPVAGGKPLPPEDADTGWDDRNGQDDDRGANGTEGRP